jgi:predicted transposase YdaD
VPKPFDAATKELLEKHPRAWLELLLGRRLGEVRVVDADLSTITSEADKIFRVEEPAPWIVHVEFQSSYNAGLPLRLQRYNVLAHYRHELPVQSVVVLMRPEASGPQLTGLLQHRLPDRSLYHEFRYNVVKVWEQPVNDILEGSLATLPLAPIARVSIGELPGIIQLMDERIEREANPADKADFWAATFLLMGLIYPDGLANTLLQGKSFMRESSTYQAILREGKAEGIAEGIAEGKAEGIAEEARRLLLRLGRKHFGPPGAALEARIHAMTDVEKLEQLSERVLDVSSWDELIVGS